jgi:hypothetical protein
LSNFRLWASILGWAALALVAAWLTQRLLFSIDPPMDNGIVALATMMAVFVAYGVRTTARHLGWARKSYARDKTVDHSS